MSDQIVLALKPENTAVSKPGKDAIVKFGVNPNGGFHQLHQIHFGYDEKPEKGAMLEICRGRAVVFRKPVSSAEPAPVFFPVPVRSGASESFTIKLTSGGDEVTGVLTVVASHSRN